MAFLLLGTIAVLNPQAQTRRYTQEIIGDPAFAFRAPLTFQMPPVSLPDSLGGKDLTGFMLVRLLVDSSGIITSYQIRRFEAKDEKLNLHIRYTYQRSHDKAKVAEYRNWLNDFVKGIKITRNPNFPKAAPVLKTWTFGYVIRFRK